MLKFLRLFPFLFLSFFFGILFTSCESADEKCVDLIPIATAEGFQYINAEGKAAFDTYFAEATLFSNGLALVKAYGKEPLYGYINAKGEFVIPPQYEQASIFSEGIAFVVKDNSAPEAINTKGETVFSIPNLQKVRIFSEGLAAVQVADSVDLYAGYVDTRGRFVIKPGDYEDGFEFHKGMALVKTYDNRYSVINRRGEHIIPIQYDLESLQVFCSQRISCESAPYSEVSTDFFSVDEVLSVLRKMSKEVIERDLFETTFGDLIKLYDLKESAFPKNKERTRIANRSLSMIVGYDIYVSGSPWVKKSGKEVFDPTKKIEGFQIFMELTGGGSGKATSVLSQCDKAFPDYIREENSSPHARQYIHAKVRVSIWEVYGNSIVASFEKTNE